MFNDFTKSIAAYLNDHDVSGYTEYDPVAARYVVHVILSDGNTTTWFIPWRYVREACGVKAFFYLDSIIEAYY